MSLNESRHDRMEAFESDRNAAGYLARLASTVLKPVAGLVPVRG